MRQTAPPHSTSALICSCCEAEAAALDRHSTKRRSPLPLILPAAIAVGDASDQAPDRRSQRRPAKAACCGGGVAAAASCVDVRAQQHVHELASSRCVNVGSCNQEERLKVANRAASVGLWCE